MRETFVDREVVPHHGTGLENNSPGQHAVTAQLRSCPEPCLNKSSDRYRKWHWPGELLGLCQCLAGAYRLDHFACLVGQPLADPSLCHQTQPMAALHRRRRAPNPTNPRGSNCSTGRSTASETTSLSIRAVHLSLAYSSVPATFPTGTSPSDISPYGMATSNLPVPMGLLGYGV